jgi:hypothetical protein
VISLGFLSILAFGGILATAGGVVRVLYDDMMSRNNISRILGRPSSSTLFWGGIAYLWMYAMGSRARFWWDRIEDFEVSRRDSFWFGFISSTTVGLGDYFLQPEVMFLEDVFRFALLFLTGFVLLSTFLSSLSEFLEARSSSLSAGERLEERLKRTYLNRMDSRSNLEADGVDATKTSSKNIKVLEGLVARGEDSSSTSFSDHRVTKNLSVLAREEELLRNLLEQTREEMMEVLQYRMEENDKKTGEIPLGRDLSVVLREEDLLKELLGRTVTERGVLEECMEARSLEFHGESVRIKGSELQGESGSTKGSNRSLPP